MHYCELYTDSDSNIPVIIAITQWREHVFIFARIDILLELFYY